MRGASLNRFFLIGSSFGGSVVLNVPNVDKIVAISPVTDYKNLYKSGPGHNYETLKSYLTDNGYRISNTGWQKLKSGNLFELSKVLKEKTLVVYSKNDAEINPIVLERFLKTKNIESICVSSNKHLSFKNVQPDIFKSILVWLEKTDGVVGYNDITNYNAKKVISKILNGLSVALLGGSLASENLILESDVDIYLISDNNISIPANKIKDHKIESIVMNFDDYTNYTKSNMRGLSKLFSSKIVTNNQSLNEKIEKLRARMMKKYKDIFLIFQLLEKKRMESIKFIDAHSPLAIKKGVGGRRSLGFMTVTYNVLNDIRNPSFWNTLELMTASGTITRIDKEHIEHFFATLIEKKLGHRELDKFFKNNDKIITDYINNYFIKKVNKAYNLGLTISEHKISVDIKGFINDLIDALYSKDQELLVKLVDKYKNYKDAIKRYTIFYYLALNSNLPFEIAEFIAINFVNEYPMHNVRRNLVENAATTVHKKLLYLLAKDPYSKVRYYAKKRLKQDNILRAEIIRY